MYVLNKKQVIVIVDAWSGGKYLLSSFQGLGFYCIHIQSGYVPPIFLEDNAQAIARSDKHIVYDGNINSLVKILRGYSIKALIAGSEGAVNLADELNHLLELPFCNTYSLSAARRNKFLMQNALTSAQLLSISQKQVSSQQELSQWIQQQQNWPVVLKPVQSAGSDGVFICHNMDEAYQAFDFIMGKPDLFKNPNRHVLCQEFLEGTEFVINGVVCAGNYFFTEGWCSLKKKYKGNPVYDTQFLCYHPDPHFEILCGYTKQVCQAVGIVNGAFHAEIMLTPKGPRLIEIGARIAGGADPYITETCLGHSQVSKLVQSVLHPKKFIREAQEYCFDSESLQAAYVYMISPKTGKVSTIPNEKFFNVPEIVSINYHYDINEIQQETRDLISAPGVIIIIHSDRKKLQDTIVKLRTIETNFYEKSIENV